MELVEGQTLKLRGAGGIVWDIDVPRDGSQQRERFEQQLKAGDLIPVDAEGVQIVEAEAEPDKGSDLASMTIAQLEAYAEEHHIGLGEATKKADILAVIEAV